MIDKNKNEMCNVPDDVLENLQKDVAQIKVALLGNEYNPTGGALYRIDTLEKESEKMNLRYERMMWTAGGAAAILTVVLNLVMFFFDKFILS